MKCQKCDLPATFHITEMTNDTPVEHHFCEFHANEYLHQGPNKIDGLQEEQSEESNEDDEKSEKSSDLAETTRDLDELDFQTCPVCGLSFQEFRKSGKFGCPNDYLYFGPQIDRLLFSIHGFSEHIGKHPSHEGKISDQLLLLRLRREMADAVEIEDYERASALRDRIRELELTK